LLTHFNGKPKKKKEKKKNQPTYIEDIHLFEIKNSDKVNFISLVKKIK
jgi:hypothetical protein